MKIAVIGSGISGLSAAYMLRDQHDVHVFEEGARPGGHSNTVTVLEGDRDVPIDTGFVVYNEVTYPGFTALLQQLNVETTESDMSLGLACRAHDLEYSSRGGLRGILAQPGAMLRPDRLRMGLDIWRFYEEGQGMLRAGAPDDMSLVEFLDQRGYGREFRRHFVVPLVGAIWSMPARNVMAYPLNSLLGFMKNHGLLSISGRLAWRTVQGGSRRYVDALVAQLPNGIRTGQPVVQIFRDKDGVTVYTGDGSANRFDHVILATHSDQTLRLLDDPTDVERSALSEIGYEPNRVVLHRDRSAMPTRRGAWSSWNYVTDACTDAPGPVSVTYHMNRLQRLDSSHDYFVTVNPHMEIDPALVVDTFEYAHPQFTKRALGAQKVLQTINGINRTHFAGAYMGRGFHEDGVRSGAAVAADLGARGGVVRALGAIG